MDYEEFLRKKQIKEVKAGFTAKELPKFLFPFQQHLVEWALQLGRAALFEDCGLGKGPQALCWADNVVRHTNGKVLILAPLAVSKQFSREADKFGFKVKITQDGTLHKETNITNYQRLKNFNPEDFKGVVCDECFSWDTKVETIGLDNSLILKYIRDIVPGDRVLNCTGVDHVKACKKKRISRVVVLRCRGRSITCSENHPFFTMYGWRSAKDLRSGDYLMETKEAMCLVRGNLSPKIPFQNKNSEILREALLSELENGYTGTQSQSSYPRNSSKTREIEGPMVSIGFPYSIKREEKTRGIESHVKSRNSTEDDGNQREEWNSSSIPSKKRGEWDWSYYSRTNIYGCTREQMDSLHSSNKHRSEFGDTYSLQNRCWEYEKEDSNRSGRTFPSFSEGSRQEERGLVGFARLDSTEILEQNDSRLEKYRDETGSLYFYDLEIERHPSFSVEGLLVHNSSILKSADGKTRKEITQFLSKIPYRLLCTATPSPNDFMELGTSSEALGNMSRNQMLGMFFTNSGETTQQWELKGHAKKRFWQWVSTWARAIRKPSDIGFDDSKFILPELRIHKHILKGGPTEGFFVKEARTLDDQRKERKRSLKERCEKVASLIPKTGSVLIWCQRNDEGDYLEKIIPDAIQVAGKDSDEDKENRLNDFATGRERILISKAKIAGFGLNLQICNKVFYFVDHSHEAYYQAIRRAWRFGQKNPVDCHLITTEVEKPVLDNMLRKEKQAIELYESVVKYMNEAIRENQQKTIFKPMGIPSWLK